MGTRSAHESDGKGTGGVLHIGTPVARPDRIHDYLDVEEVDVIGDVHGCIDELTTLLRRLGYDRFLDDPEARRSTRDTPSLFFVGDLVDRGTDNVPVLQLVMQLVDSGIARCVIGNHDHRFLRWLRGHDVKIAHGIESTISEFNEVPQGKRESFRERVIDFFESLPYAIRFDRGKAVVVHAAWRPTMKVEEEDRKLRYYALHGPSTGERTEEGFPVRIDWSTGFRGPEHAIYGHQVYLQPKLDPYATGIDTGCVFGGALSALRYPDRTIVQVKSVRARAAYSGPLDLPNADNDDS